MKPPAIRRCTLFAVLFILSCLHGQTASAQKVLVQPYVQPGDGRSLVGTDVKVIHWWTDQTAADFVVEYQTPWGKVQSMKPACLALDFAAPPPPKPKEDSKKEEAKKKAATDDEDEDEPKEPKDKKKETKPAPPPPEKDQHYFKYTAKLAGLPFNADVRYRVKLGDQVIREGTFRTRATADKSVRCVLVGDMATGGKGQKEVAYRISQHKPEFLVALGDIVYSTGRVSQYMHHYWDTYNNVSQAGPATGAPLMAGVPFYPVLGNHDIAAKLSNTPDALAVYHFFSPPQSGPGEGSWTTPLGTDKVVAGKFRAATPDSYPNLDAYSFDYGPAHFVAINNNSAVKVDAPAFRKWLLDDLKSSKARWKFVCFHVPGFHSSKQHYAEQQSRLLEPIFEEGGVDLTFAGHVHNYQRSVPLTFVPLRKKKAQVDGEFTLDTDFDGVKKTTPKGIIHILAGGGGAGLYGPGLDKTTDYLHKTYGCFNYADFTARLVADKHSFVVLDISPDRLELRAIGANGNELDHITITKLAPSPTRKQEDHPERKQ
jgi:hypothetical protein